MLKMAELPANVFPVIIFSVTVESDENETSLTIFMTSSVTYEYDSFVIWRFRCRNILLFF